MKKIKSKTDNNDVLHCHKKDKKKYIKSFFSIVKKRFKFHVKLIKAAVNCIFSTPSYIFDLRFFFHDIGEHVYAV